MKPFTLVRRESCSFGVRLYIPPIAPASGALHDDVVLVRQLNDVGPALGTDHVSPFGSGRVSRTFENSPDSVSFVEEFPIDRSALIRHRPPPRAQVIRHPYSSIRSFQRTVLASGPKSRAKCAPSGCAVMADVQSVVKQVARQYYAANLPLDRGAARAAPTFTRNPRS